MNKKILSALLLLISSFANPLLADEAGISVENAWIAEAPPVSKVMVAYMTIKNNSDEAIAITKAESKLYSSIEFHESIHKDGMSRMIRYDALNIPAHSSIQLKRGGKHFMLFNPTRHLQAGDTVDIKLTTDKNTDKTISVTVKKAQY
jgi:copper(I)-binding protein